MAVGEPARAAVAAMLAGWREELPEVRWVRPEGVHLSDHFCGRLDPAEVGPALAAVGPAVAARPAFELRLGGPGCFPDRGPARVLWLSVAAGGDQLAGLAQGCRRGLAGAGFAVEPGRLRPHCTVGRPRRPMAGADRAAWLATPVGEQPGFRADRLTLYESRPGPGGSVYIPQAELVLGGG